MIDTVRGEVLHVALDHVVVDVGGLGYRVHATPVTLSGLRRGEQASLTTTLVVREDSLTLYGFDGPAARGLFALTQTVSGVGPRLAMAILAVLDTEALTRALAEGDVKTLTRVPGIGKRTAERMVVELRDKVDAPAGGASGVAGGDGSADAAGTSSGAGSDGVLSGVREQVIEGLAGLGFSAAAAEKATDSVLAESAEDGPEQDVSAILRAALSRLGPAR